MYRRSLAATSIALVLFIVACGAPQPTPTTAPTLVPPTATPAPLRVGLVTDASGLDDLAWNASAWRGLELARDQLGAEIAYVESAQEADYAAHIDQLVGQGYGVIVTVGASMAEVTRSAAEQHADVHFVIVAFAHEAPLPNLLGLVSAADRSAFLAGYLAGGMTGSGKVGTYGAIEFPPVVGYMVGLRAGVEHYNQERGTAVEVLGMDRFLGGFDNTAASRRTAEELIAAGADVLMPVAGPAGRAGADVALEHPGTMFIGVDFDWCLRFEELCPITLTSVAPPFDTAVLLALQTVSDGTFQSGTLEAVGLSPLHEFDDRVPAELLAELDQVRQGLMDGSITTGW